MSLFNGLRRLLGKNSSLLLCRHRPSPARPQFSRRPGQATTISDFRKENRQNGLRRRFSHSQPRLAGAANGSLASSPVSKRPRTGRSFPGAGKGRGTLRLLRGRGRIAVERGRIPHPNVCWKGSFAMTDPDAPIDPRHAHHDMGGLPAGPVDASEHDYALWEKRVDAMMVLLSSKGADDRRRAQAKHRGARRRRL